MGLPLHSVHPWGDTGRGTVHGGSMEAAGHTSFTSSFFPNRHVPAGVLHDLLSLDSERPWSLTVSCATPGLHAYIRASRLSSKSGSLRWISEIVVRRAAAAAGATGALPRLPRRNFAVDRGALEVHLHKLPQGCPPTPPNLPGRHARIYSGECLPLRPIASVWRGVRVGKQSAIGHLLTHTRQGSKGKALCGCRRRRRWCWRAARGGYCR